MTVGKVCSGRCATAHGVKGSEESRGGIWRGVRALVEERGGAGGMMRRGFQAFCDEVEEPLCFPRLFPWSW